MPPAPDTSTLIRRLDEVGFVILPERIPRAQALRLAERLRHVGPDENRHHVLNRLRPDELADVLPLVSDPLCLALARHALGDGFQLCGDPGTLWAQAEGRTIDTMLHADVPVGWFVERGLPVPAANAVLNCLWALTDFTPENGATRVIPCSHHARRPPAGDDYDGLYAVGAMPAGSVLVMHAAIWHRRGVNTTGQDRMGVSVPYIAGWLDPVTMGWERVRASVHERLPDGVRALLRHPLPDPAHACAAG